MSSSIASARPVAARRQLAGARDPDGVVAAARSARPAARSRSGTRAGRAGPSAPDEPGSASSSRRIESATVRCSPMPARWWPVDHACTSGPRRIGEARSETASTPSTRSGSGSSDSSSRRAHLPERPAVERGEHERLARRPALEHAAPARSARRCRRRCRWRPGPPHASRSATTTIWRRERPARRPITLTSRSPAWLKRCRSTGKPLAAQRAGHALGRLRVADRCPAGGRARRSAIRLASVAATRPSNRTSAARPWGSGRGRLCSENIVSTTASRAGTNAAL